MAFAEEAMRRAGLEPKLTIVRGGTDGSRLTEMGLPTPNLSTRRAQPPLAAGVDLPGRDGRRRCACWSSWRRLGDGDPDACRTVGWKQSHRVGSFTPICWHIWSSGQVGFGLVPVQMCLPGGTGEGRPDVGGRKCYPGCGESRAVGHTPLSNALLCSVTE